MRRVTKIQLFILENLVWVLVILFFLFNAIATESFFTFKNQVNIIFQSSLMGMLVLAQGIVMMVGELDLSIDAILAFAPAMTILFVTTVMPLNPFVAILMTLLLGVLVGFINGFFVARMKSNSFLLTLSTQIVMRGIILFLIPFSIAGLDPAYTYVGRGRLFGEIPVAAVAFILIFLGFEFLFNKTIFGRKFLLTGGNRRASYISGINTNRVIIYAFIIAGLLAAVAGLIATGRQNAVSNGMGSGMVMMAFAGAILGGSSFNGGVGKPIGMLGGALLLGMIDNALTLRGVNVNLVYATKGGLIFLAIMLDRAKDQINDHIMYKENIRRLTSTEDGLEKAS